MKWLTPKPRPVPKKYDVIETMMTIVFIDELGEEAAYELLFIGKVYIWTDGHVNIITGNAFARRWLNAIFATGIVPVGVDRLVPNHKIVTVTLDDIEHMADQYETAWLSNPREPE